MYTIKWLHFSLGLCNICVLTPVEVDRDVESL